MLVSSNHLRYAGRDSNCNSKKHFDLYRAKQRLNKSKPAPNQIHHNAGRINVTSGLTRLQAGVAQGWIDWAHKVRKLKLLK
jgi:hypothetical protein